MSFFTGYLAAAKRLSISSGIGSNLFAPEKEKTLSSFTDLENIASWAMEAVKYLVESGIISRSGDKLFPTSTATRAEMAQILCNLLSK